MNKKEKVDFHGRVAVDGYVESQRNRQKKQQPCNYFGAAEEWYVPTVARLGRRPWLVTRGHQARHRRARPAWSNMWTKSTKSRRTAGQRREVVRWFKI